MAGQSLSYYEIIEKLGEGGMGEVYKARDTRLGRLVAIKVLRSDRISDPNRKRRFMQEAKAASALNHPNIVTIYDIGSENGVDFIVMEFISGQSLDRVIPRQGMRVSDALDHALPVADALAKAHAAGIVHRDLKPGNILVADDGTLKLVDFGLAKLVESVPATEAATAADEDLTEEGAILGTVSYMSPEQAEGKPVDARSDIFSFGALLYEMLTGQKAFQRDSRVATLSAILREEPALLADFPRGLERIVVRCLHKEPAKRWQSMGDLRTLLQEYKEDSSAEIARGAHSPRKSMVRRFAVLFAVGLLIVGVGLAAWLLHGTETPPQDQILHAVPFTSFPGSEDAPSFSPDGSQIVFSWDGEQQDNVDIYVKRIGPGKALRLTNDPAHDTRPTWSPDGNMIAFFRAIKPGRHSVVLIPPLGGPEKVVAEIPAFEGAASEALEWTPDSKSLVFFDRPESQPGGLWLLTVETGERRRLTTLPQGAVADVAAAFSPDRRTLAFARETNPNVANVFLLPLQQDLTPRGEPRQITQANDAVWGLVWTADGKDLIVASGQPGDSGLWRLAASGDGRPTRLTEHEVQKVAISWKSNRLVFVQSTRELDIYRVDLTAQGAETRSTPLIVSSRLDRYPRYSADGKNIAFVSLRSGNWQLWMCNSDGSNPIQLTFFERGETRRPVWSIDGKQIQFNSTADGRSQDYVIDVAGGKPRKLEDLGKEAAARLFPTPNVSADGKLRYFTRGGSMWSVPLEGGQEHEVFKYATAIQAFEVRRAGIYFLTPATVTPGEAMFYRFPNGPITKIAGAESPSQFGLSVSPDERSLIYAKLTSSGSDLMLVESFK